MTLDLDSVDQELENSFSVYFLLLWILIRVENTLLGETVSSDVPDENVAVSTEEEVEPVSIGRRDHPLVNKSIWVAHDDSRLVLVSFLFLGI